ncbi:hypothetical protein cypCar_00003230 [Cyprinus carpio]|nr:hypothetical protein cypCar_00003230 [Cyprinus carpio]
MVAMTKRVKVFEIVFNDPSKTFYCSGDKVAGKILVEVLEVTRVTCMKVLGVGCAKVEYAKGKQRCREEVDYLKYEDVVHLDDHPADSSKGIYAYLLTDTDGSVILRPGNKYEYSFGFELPQQGQLVSTYKGKFGFVQYFVKALMERPAQPAMECRKHFEVEEPLDVNTPDLLSPTGGMKEKKVTCMFIPDGQGKSIRVPKIKPSILGCNIIRVEYALMIYMHIPGSDKLVLELPLVIGTVPYNGFSSRTNSMSSQDGSVSNASNSWVSLRMPSAPPSYCDVTRDCSLDQPLTPLLDDYDGGDSPIFMNAPQFQFPPLPAYSEVDEEYNGNARMLPVC